MDATFFESFSDLYGWLEAHHDSESELWVGIYKVDSGQSGITYKQVVDAVLCFGWIDGIRKTIDDERWRIRITPRTRNSTWSAVNVQRMKELIEESLVRPAGMRVFDERAVEKSQQYSYERASVELPPDYIDTFRESPEAWEFFEAQPPSYRKAAVWWVMSAKQEATRAKRLRQLIDDSRERRRLGAVTYTKKE